MYKYYEYDRLIQWELWIHMFQWLQAIRIIAYLHFKALVNLIWMETTKELIVYETFLQGWFHTNWKVLRRFNFLLRIKIARWKLNLKIEAT